MSRFSVSPEDRRLERAIRPLAEQLDQHFFAGRLRIASSVKFYWLSEFSPYAGACDPFARTIGISPSLAEGPRRRPIVTTLLRQMAHLSTANEHPAHGPRWRDALRRAGLDPMTSSVMRGGLLERWMLERGI